MVEMIEMIGRIEMVNDNKKMIGRIEKRTGENYV